MQQIPEVINNVLLEFDASVDRNVTDEMYAAMLASISKEITDDDVLEKLWVSSANDQHKCPSRHKTGNAIDISRVNGKKISIYYDADRSVKRIVDALQTKFESAPHRRENFGPSIQKKEGLDRPIGGHNDHFHWSVNGDHSECIGMLRRVFEWIRLDKVFFNESQSNENRNGVCNR